MNPFYEINKPLISPAFEKRSVFWQKISTNIRENKKVFTWFFSILVENKSV
jgi:hypothetical protein